MGLYLFCRQIYDAGVNSDHLKNVRQAAFESTKAAVRRLSMKCANQERSSVMSKSQTSKKKKEGRVSPETRYINFKVKPPKKTKNTKTWDLWVVKQSLWRENLGALTYNNYLPRIKCILPTFVTHLQGIFDQGWTVSQVWPVYSKFCMPLRNYLDQSSE